MWLLKKQVGNISQITNIANLCKDNLTIYSGNDDQILPICSLGGLGVISVLSNIKPKLTHDIVTDFLNGNISAAKDKQLSSLDIINSLFSEVNPIPIKFALNYLGFNFGNVRLPLTELTEKNKQSLIKLIEGY